MSGLTFDAGALIAIERSDRRMVGLLTRAALAGVDIVIPAGVVSQVWRDGSRQVRLARLLKSPKVRVEVLDASRAREVGQLCGASSTADIVDASVVICARRLKHMVVTSDPDDLRRLDPSLQLEVV